MARACLVVHEGDGKVGGVDAVAAGGRVLGQEGDHSPELQAQQQHGRVQQRLLAALAVVGGRELGQVALQVRQLEALHQPACSTGAKTFRI